MGVLIERRSHRDSVPESLAVIEPSFRATFEIAPVGIAHVGADGRFLLVNQALCASLGYMREELFARTVKDVSHPDDAGLADPQILHLHAGELEVMHVEQRFLDKGGRTVWMNVRVVQHAPGGGRAPYEVAVFEDVSERKAVEQALELSERRCRTLIEYAAEGIVLVDTAGRLGHASVAGSRMLGYVHGEVAGMRGLELVHPDDRDAAMSAIGAVLADPAARVELRVRARCKDGTHRLLVATLRNLLAEPSVAAIVVNFRVLTDEGRTAARGDSEERFRHLVELASDWYWELDAEFRFTCFEGQNVGPDSTQRERLLGKRPWEAALECEGGWDAHRAQLEAHEPFQEVTLRHPLSDGSWRYLSVSGAPVVDHAGRFAGYRGIGRSITASRRDQQLLRLEHTVTRRLAEADDAAVTLRDVLRIVCETEGWDCGRYWRVDEQAGVLRFAEGWSVPGPETEAFVAGSRGLTFAPGTGLAGRVWKSGEAIWVPDVTTDVHVVASAVARSSGIRGASLFPVISDGKTIGVLNISSRQVREPDQRLLQAMRVIGSQIGQFLQRKQAEEVLRESEERFRGLNKLSSDWYWEQDAQFRFTFMSTKHTEETGVANSSVLGKARWEIPTFNMTAEDWARHRAQVERHEPFYDLETCRVNEHGNKRWLSVSGQPIFDTRGAFKGYRGVGKDITVRKRAEQLLQLEHTVTRRLAEAESVSAGLIAVIREVCETENWECGRYFGVDSAAGVLRLNEGWSIADEGLQQFVARSRSIEYRLGVGLAGRVWQSGEPLWVADLTQDPRALKMGFSVDLGIRGAFVFPVTAEGTTIGVLAFNSREIRTAEDRLLQSVRVIGSQIGQFVQRKQAEEVLRESEERFRSLTELSSDWYWQQDEHFRFVSSSTDVFRGKMRWELPDARPLSATWEEHRATLEAHLPFRDFEYVRVDQDGRVRYTSVTGVPIFDRDGVFRGYRGMAKDITQRKVAEERLTLLAQFDPLTGLPNRSLLRDRLEQALAQASRKRWQVGVLFLDLDRFKLVNDTLGHQKGDVLLAEVAKRLGTCARPGDTIGRISGDEFAIVLAELAHADDAAIVAQRMINALAAPFDLDGHEAFVGASIGISVYPGDSADPDVLLMNADVAMYRAKESGRNGYCFYTAEMNQRSAAKLALNNDLRRALARGEFEVHYQPKVNLDGGAVCGMEALLRWRHPDRGMVLPGEFIPALEETGLIVPAGEWVVRAVCEQVKAWQESGLAAVPVAVNLSARQFQQKDLDARIRAAVDGTGIDPSLIELEITESQLIRDPEHAIRVMRNLRDAGIRISVDDFGTGYSSLAYLRQLPISALKIDRSFVRNVHQDENDAAIVRAIIDLAHNLRFTVVAEGVETEAQAALLRAHGCEAAQGYLFGRPAPALEVARQLSPTHDRVRSA